VVVSIRAHFDGRVIVPDEPVQLPVNTSLTVSISTDGAPGAQGRPPRPVEDRLAAHARFSGSVSVGSLPKQISRADNFYQERE